MVDEKYLRRLELYLTMKAMPLAPDDRNFSGVQSVVMQELGFYSSNPTLREMLSGHVVADSIKILQTAAERAMHEAESAPVEPAAQFQAPELSAILES